MWATIIILGACFIAGMVILAIRYLDYTENMSQINGKTYAETRKEEIQFEIEKERTEQKRLELERSKIQYNR
jgi:hypothetical protein